MISYLLYGYNRSDRLPSGSKHSTSEEETLPTRRTLELAIVVVVAMRPVFGLVKLWSRKTLDNSTPGSVSHGVAEILTVVT